MLPFCADSSVRRFLGEHQSGITGSDGAGKRLQE
jgi:hypothetical protein